MNEEAALKERLKDVDEMLSLVAEAFTKALFDLSEDVIEVGSNEGIDRTSDRGEKETILATANDSSVVVRELEGLAEFAVFVLKFFYEAGEVILDFTRS